MSANDEILARNFSRYFSAVSIDSDTEDIGIPRVKVVTMADGDVTALVIAPLQYNSDTLQFEWARGLTLSGDVNITLETANLENMMVNLHDTIVLLSRKITLLTEVLKGGIGGGAHELTLDDIEED